MSDFNKSSSFNAELSSPDRTLNRKNSNNNTDVEDDIVVSPNKSSKKGDDTNTILELLQKISSTQELQSSTQELQSSTLLHMKTELKTELTTVKTELKTELTTVKTELTTVKTELTTVKTELRTVKTELRTVKTELRTASRTVQKLELEHNFKKYDPWKDMAETDRSKTQKLRSKIIPSKVEDVCWLTGRSPSSNKLAHILPDSTPKDVLELLKLPREFRNDPSAKRWNFMILRNDIEEAFDAKKISFVPIDLFHPNEFKLKIWAKDGLMEDVLKLEGCKLNVPPGIELCRRALSYQALMAYLTLKYQGKAALDLEEPAEFSSEYEGKDETRKKLASTLNTAIVEESTEDGDENEVDDEVEDEENL